jgi:hypothetical protein
MTTDTRPWNIESSYYQATRSQVRTQFDGLTLEKIKPVRAWWPDLAAGVCLLVIFVIVAVWP